MDILFVHGNYPAQFRSICSAIGAEGTHRVIFLTARPNNECENIPGVEVRNYHEHRAPDNRIHHYLRETENAVIAGQAVVRAIDALIAEGINPRVVITHGGVGLGIFIKNCFPQVKHIGYFEWYFRKETTKHIVNNLDMDTVLSSDMRNISILKELETCDAAVVPTDWQREQFPKEFKEKLHVIFDGIDTSFFRKSNKDLAETNVKIKNRETGETYYIRPTDMVLSYGTRGMEPVRGFPEFMRSLPSLLGKYEHLKVIIAGADRRAYSYDSPIKGGSWKEYLMNELQEKGCMHLNRISFVGLLDYIDYRKLLWRTNLHCYLTRPYVTSWSLFEAAACGAILAVSKGPATEGIVVKDSVVWVDLDEKNMNLCLEKALKHHRKSSDLNSGYELQESLKKWENFLGDVLKKE